MTEPPEGFLKGGGQRSQDPASLLPRSKARIIPSQLLAFP